MSIPFTESCVGSAAWEPETKQKAHSEKECRQCASEAARLDFLVTVFEAIFSTSMGILTGSAGLHALSLLMLGDIFSKGINWLAVYLSHRKPTRQFPYGYGRIQFLSAVFIGVLLTAGGILMFVHNINDIQNGLILKAGLVAIFSSSLLAASSWLMYRIMQCTADHNNNPAIRAAAMDNRVDTWSAIMVLIGAILTHFQFLTADRIMALVVSLFVVKLGVSIISDGIHGLLDMGLPEEVHKQILHYCQSELDVATVKSLRGRRLGGRYEIEMELFVPGESSVRTMDDLRVKLNKVIKRNIKHVNEIHIIMFSNPSS
ncbi:MAG: cation transporter [Magnetococcales bacterium]|nr:cation transporter [Magnetococcales bacterium]